MPLFYRAGSYGGCRTVVVRELPKLLTAVRFRSPALVFLCVALLAGCTQYVEPAGSSDLFGGVTHRVGRGETLWSIAKNYRVQLKDLIETNRIADVSQVKAGQVLRIPSPGGGEIPADVSVDPVGIDFIWPVEGRVVSIFGMRRGTFLNKGIDIQAPFGREVFASRPGVVSFIHEDLPGYGKTIILDHKDGFATVYAYIGQILVQQGQAVSRRQVIARVGKTGRADVSALHFEIRRRQRPENPFRYLP